MLFRSRVEVLAKFQPIFHTRQWASQGLADREITGYDIHNPALPWYKDFWRYDPSPCGRSLFFKPPFSNYPFYSFCRFVNGFDYTDSGFLNQGGYSYVQYPVSAQIINELTESLNLL